MVVVLSVAPLYPQKRRREINLSIQTSGSSLHPDFFPRWLLELSVTLAAIIVTPNYRLLPESNAIDILEDMDDLWDWLTPGLDNLLGSSARPGIQADRTRIMTVGESAGKLWKKHVFFCANSISGRRLPQHAVCVGPRPRGRSCCHCRVCGSRYSSCCRCWGTAECVRHHVRKERRLLRATGHRRPLAFSVRHDRRNSSKGEAFRLFSPRRKGASYR